MRYFILGGKGFMGSAFVRYCEKAGLEYAVITRQNYDAFVGKSCTVFINANGNSSKVLAEREPLSDFDASVRSVRRTLVDFKFDRYIHLSTCDVYSDCSSPATTDEDQAVPVTAQSKYGFHKRLAELCVQHGAPDSLIFRLGGAVGPGLRKNAIYDILNGGPLWLDPESRLQFLSTDAIPDIVAQVMAAPCRNEVFNLCGDGLVALSEVMEWVGHEIDVQPGAPCVRYEVNVEKLKSVASIPETHTAVREFVERWMETGAVRGHSQIP